MRRSSPARGRRRSRSHCGNRSASRASGGSSRRRAQLLPLGHPLQRRPPLRIVLPSRNQLPRLRRHHRNRRQMISRPRAPLAYRRRHACRLGPLPTSTPPGQRRRQHSRKTCAPHRRSANASTRHARLYPHQPAARRPCRPVAVHLTAHPSRRRPAASVPRARRHRARRCACRPIQSRATRSRRRGRSRMTSGPLPRSRLVRWDRRRPIHRRRRTRAARTPSTILVHRAVLRRLRWAVGMRHLSERRPPSRGNWSRTSRAG